MPTDTKRITVNPKEKTIIHLSRTLLKLQTKKRKLEAARAAALEEFDADIQRLNQEIAIASNEVQAALPVNG